MHAPSDPIRFCVRSDDAPLLDLALTHALSSWTMLLATGQPSHWADYAATAHRLRNALATRVAGEHCVWLTAPANAAEVLHVAARTCEAHPDHGPDLASVARRNADRATLGEKACDAPGMVTEGNAA